MENCSTQYEQCHLKKENVKLIYLCFNDHIPQFFHFSPRFRRLQTENQKKSVGRSQADIPHPGKFIDKTTTHILDVKIYSQTICLIGERKREEKQVQIVSGVSKLTYWFSTFIWDVLIMLCFLTICLVVILGFDISSFTARQNLPAALLLIFAFWLYEPYAWEL